MFEYIFDYISNSYLFFKYTFWYEILFGLIILYEIDSSTQLSTEALGSIIKYNGQCVSAVGANVGLKACVYICKCVSLPLFEAFDHSDSACIVSSHSCTSWPLCNTVQ